MIRRPWRSPPPTRTACRTPEWCCSRVERIGLRILYQRGKRKGTPTRREHAGGGAVPLEIVAPAGATARPGDADAGRRGRRLFRLPRARQPHRRLGQPTVPAARKPLRAGESRRPLRLEVRDRRNSPPALLARLHDRPVSIEFWADKPFRLHDRVRFTREAPGSPGPNSGFSREAARRLLAAPPADCRRGRAHRGAGVFLAGARGEFPRGSLWRR